MTTKQQTLDNNFELHLMVENHAINAIDLLEKHCQFSRQKIKKIMQNGAVWLTINQTTQRIRRAKKILQPGQSLHCYYNDDIFNQLPLTPILIADEGDYSIWFKPAGMLSQGSKYGDHCAIYRWVESNLTPQRNAFIVHRLDKATSGLIIIAHSKTAAVSLSKLFADGAINKFYQAIVHGKFPDKEALPLILDNELDGKVCKTKILKSQNFTANNQSYSQLDIQIITGRKHQIRQHLALAKHPIVGDRLYGTGENDGYDLCLCAYKINFLSPFNKQKQYYELESSYYLTPLIPP